MRPFRISLCIALAVAATAPLSAQACSNADIPNSGATLAHLSPGFTLNFSRRFAGFVFVQVPIWQRVNGLQLEPRYSMSAGLHYIFQASYPQLDSRSVRR